eukprot:snap_masked-scaffold_79-processed-gene-0.8-mRNA-1 protein AED:1.00 eAED:1.00 QI:0/-1/0/0/-1/1/1/0/65
MIISLVDIFLQKYKKEQRNYVLKVALLRIILLRLEIKVKSFIISELIPILEENRKKADRETKDII